MPKTLKQFIAENSEPLDENIENLVGLRHVRRATDPDTRRMGGYVLPPRGEKEREILQHHLRHSLGVHDVEIEQRERGDYPWSLGDYHAPKEVYTDIPPYRPSVRESEELFESEKPYVAVVLDEPRGISYTVVKSTFDHPLGKVGAKLTDVGMDKLEMMHHKGDIHLENLSAKGSGPGSKYGQMPAQLPRVVLMKHNDRSGNHTVTNHDELPAHVGERARKLVKYNSIVSPDDYSMLAQLHHAGKIELSPPPLH